MRLKRSISYQVGERIIIIIIIIIITILFFFTWGLTVLPRLTWNSWAQVICLPQLPT
jgi:hypothetical protein